MVLYLLRHAEAVSHAESDEKRELTDKGISQAKRAGLFCKHHVLVPNIIFSSPLTRAMQTAATAAEQMGSVEVSQAEFLASGMQPDEALAEMKTWSRFESVMLVGHEPDFSSLAARLIDAPANRLRLKKASLTALDIPAGKASSAVLLFSLPVKMM